MKITNLYDNVEKIGVQILEHEADDPEPGHTTIHVVDLKQSHSVDSYYVSKENHEHH